MAGPEIDSISPDSQSNAISRKWNWLLVISRKLSVELIVYELFELPIVSSHLTDVLTSLILHLSLTLCCLKRRIIFSSIQSIMWILCNLAFSGNLEVILCSIQYFHCLHFGLGLVFWDKVSPYTPVRVGTHYVVHTTF